jgi:hypothetical protein
MGTKLNEHKKFCVLGASKMYDWREPRLEKWAVPLFRNIHSLFSSFWTLAFLPFLTARILCLFCENVFAIELFQKLFIKLLLHVPVLLIYTTIRQVYMSLLLLSHQYPPFFTYIFHDIFLMTCQHPLSVEISKVKVPSCLWLRPVYSKKTSNFNLQIKVEWTGKI